MSAPSVTICLACECRLAGELWHGPACRCERPNLGTLAELENKFRARKAEAMRAERSLHDKGECVGSLGGPCPLEGGV